MHSGQRREGLGPHSGLLRRWRGPRGSRTQGCEQHGPPQDEVPLRREGARSGPVVAVGSCSPREGGQGGQFSASLGLSFLTIPRLGYPPSGPAGTAPSTAGLSLLPPVALATPQAGRPLQQHPQVPGPWARGFSGSAGLAPPQLQTGLRALGPEHCHPMPLPRAACLPDLGDPTSPSFRATLFLCHPISSLTARPRPRPRPPHWTLVPAAPGAALPPPPPPPSALPTGLRSLGCLHPAAPPGARAAPQL